MIGKSRPLLTAVTGTAALAMLSGCVASPTYGTDRSAGQQLVDDLGGIMTFSPQSAPEIAYNPRPELVRPASTDTLPAPQESVVTAGEWPESPEQRRERIRAETTNASGEVGFRSQVASSAPSSGRFIPSFDEAPGRVSDGITSVDRAEVNRRLADRRQGSETSRRYLSEPPLDYRRPSESAPVGDVGEDEWRKERRLEQASGSGRGLRDLIPW